nr:MAG TPA: hypothetical protein [Caudoviricetes sp.]
MSYRSKNFYQFPKLWLILLIKYQPFGYSFYYYAI